MSSVVKTGSGPYTILDEKKRKRMMSNRESARRSRMKRQKHMEDLLTEKSSLERKIQEDDEKYTAVWQSWSLLCSENKILRDEKDRLAEYLKYLDQISDKFQVSAYDHDIEVHDRFLKPWKVPITSSTTFTYLMSQESQ